MIASNTIDMAIGFAGVVARTIGSGADRDWSADDVQELTDACRSVRDKVQAGQSKLEHSLTEGVEVASFLRESEHLLQLLDQAVRDHATAQPCTGSLKDHPCSPQMTVAVHQLVAEFDLLGTSLTQLRSLLQKTIAAMKAPPTLVDLDRIRAAQEAFRHGDTRPYTPLARTRQPSANPGQN
jgi:hypothetical protein